MNCAWRETGRTRHGLREVACRRAGCGNVMYAPPDTPLSRVKGICRHPVMLAPGDVVSRIAKMLGFTECAKCRRRRDRWNDRWSLPVPGLVVRLLGLGRDEDPEAAVRRLQQHMERQAAARQAGVQQRAIAAKIRALKTELAELLRQYKEAKDGRSLPDK